MWIKICANTNLDDARLAADLGANAVGFVFAPSSRRIDAAQVRQIALQLPVDLERIGVFDTADPDEILRTVEEAGLTGVQLHGSLDLALVRRLGETSGRRITLIQAIHWDTRPDAPSPDGLLRRQLQQIRGESAVQRVLLDSRVGTAKGGTGVAFDWAAAADVLQAEMGNLKLIVAGGLDPENVREAIRMLDPWGVDVASGIEFSPGKKDPKKVEAFIRKAST